MAGLAEMEDEMDERKHEGRFLSVNQILEQGIYDRRIYSTLVSRDAYDGYDDVPGRYTEDGEYAMVYRLLLGRDAESVTSLVVSDQLAEAMSIDEEGLHEAAARNTPELFPPKVEKIVDVLKGFEAEDLPGMEEDIKAGMLGAPEVQDIYVVTNETNCMGAGAMYYKDKRILQDLSESLQSDLITLPSSVHEMLVMPDDGQKKAEELEKMIGGVNSMVVMPQEVLGRRALRYDRDTNGLSVYGRDANRLSAGRDQGSSEREQDVRKKKAIHSHPMRRGGR